MTDVDLDVAELVIGLSKGAKSCENDREENQFFHVRTGLDAAPACAIQGAALASLVGAGVGCGRVFW